MSTIIKPQISKNNEYYIPKYRFLELKNFCLQYSDWKKAINSIDGFSGYCRSEIMDKKVYRAMSSVEFSVINREEFKKRIDFINKAADIADKEIAKWLIIGVTNPVSYDYLKNIHGIPCSRDTYYRRYRKFFFILDKIRG